MNNEILQKNANIVSNNILRDLKTISSIVYHYDIEKIFDGITDLKNKDIDNILEICINNYLKKISQYSLKLEQLKRIELDVDEFIDFYSKKDMEEIIEEATLVSCDLILKVSGHNKRNIKLPIQIEYIKSFCIHNIIKDKDINTTILYIALYLSIVCYCIDNNDYNVVK